MKSDSAFSIPSLQVPNEIESFCIELSCAYERKEIKVKIIIKTQNNFARVSKVRGLRLWQMLMPNRIRVGVFNRNELPNIRYVFNKPALGAANSKELANWAAATTHNSIIEFREYTTEFNLTQPPENLHVMVTNWGKM